MAEVAVNGEGGSIDLVEARKALLSNSTKRRTSELETLHDILVKRQGVCDSQISTTLSLLFDTYPLYIDNSSRLAVERCLHAIAIAPGAEKILAGFVGEIEHESTKPTIAPANAFVLVRWSALLLQSSATREDLWNALHQSILVTMTNALNTVLGNGLKKSTSATAVRVSRRAFRTVAEAASGEQLLNDCITLLTTKAAEHSKNAMTLGIIAGVCRRLPGRERIVKSRKQDYIAFYLREILGSRIQLPDYIANALTDFFAFAVNTEDLKSNIIPAVEKSLLRAPEVVLNDLVSPMFAALPKDMDLSDVLASGMLKPLISNIKSSNAAVRNGALHAFEVIASLCHDVASTDKVANELLAPLKAGKVISADQRVVHARMLAALDVSESLTASMAPSLLAVASKETNETAASAELHAAVHYLQYALKGDIKVEIACADAFRRGLDEKKMPMRRLWALGIADLICSLDSDTLQKESTGQFVDPCLGKLIDNFNDVYANPVQAIQNGQVPIAFAAAALGIEKATMFGSLASSSVLRKADLTGRLLQLDPKPSFLLNPRTYTKLSAAEDYRWFLHTLRSTFPSLSASDAGSSVSIAWTQAIIFTSVATTVPSSIRHESVEVLRAMYLADPQKMAPIIIQGLWQWSEDVFLEAKDSAAIVAKTENNQLYKVVRAVCPIKADRVSAKLSIDKSIVDAQLISLVVLCRPELIPRCAWIDLCLRAGSDPGTLAATNPTACLAQILRVTENDTWKAIPDFQLASYNAAAELVFVAPEAMTPLVVAQIGTDLDAKQLEGIGPTEAAIYRTPEGTAFVDVLSRASQTTQISKTAKDYDTLKWEEDLRAQLAQKKGQGKKLTADEQSKVNAQLTKEASIRQTVAQTILRMRRGIGFIVGLAAGPPTETEAWFAPSVKLLFDAIQAGAGLILGDTAALGYLQCASQTSTRLGTMRPFIGVATLRSAAVTILPTNLQAESLRDLVTRVLYRLRSLGEQRPFDAVTLNYILPLIFLVLDNAGIECSSAEDADEQIVLAVEFLSFHTEVCSDPGLPRQRLLMTLISAMQRYTQHFRSIRDCFAELCRCVAPNMTESETDVVVQGTIVPDPSVRGASLQAISAEMELTDRKFYEEIWLACHDDLEEHVEVAKEIWEENDLQVVQEAPTLCLPFLDSRDTQLRRAAARAISDAIRQRPRDFDSIFTDLQDIYSDRAKARKPELDKYGMPVKKDLSDPWETRHGIALTFKEFAPTFPAERLVAYVSFLIEQGPLRDSNGTVRDSMVEAATTVVATQGSAQVEPLMTLCENTLGAKNSTSQSSDLVHEAVVILYGALAQHLPSGDARVPKVVQQLLATLSVPSESVQYAVAQCLPPLVRASSEKAQEYLQQTIDETLHSKKYAARRGAAYGLAGIVKGKGISALKDSRVMSTLRAATENKKDLNERQGAFLAYELLSHLLGRVFEPYVIRLVPQFLAGFGDSSADVREACLDAAKTSFSSLSSYGVKQVLPTLLEGLSDQQWRSKKGASDSLGAMAYLDPQQLAVSLPEIIPPLTEVLNDSHKEVRTSANRSLQRFGEVISNPEVKSQVNILLKALSDPTKYTDDALDALIKVNFIHYLDAPSLALVVRILERGLGDRSATKRKAAQIIGSLAHLTERRDLISHLPPLIAGLRVAIVDPVPTTRATASKALGSTIEKLGEDALPDLIPSLMQTLKSDTGAGDRLGSAQALSEVLAGLGTTRLEEILPTILQNIASSKAAVREGFMSLFIFLPACFGQSFANYLARIIPPILAGLADDVESIRETALRAGRLLVKNFAARSIDLLLPELERGLADDSHRIRLSSVELVGDLLFNLTGISGKADEAEEVEESANEAGASLLEVLGEEKRNKVLAALYICRNDTSGLVRAAAIGVWKALVSTPRTLRELIPTLTQLLIRRLASSNMEQKVIAGNALGELIRKAGEGVLATLLPTLEEGLQSSTDTDARQGICIALRELITSATTESLEDYEKTLISVVRTALVDPDEDVREAAAESFDALQKAVGKRAVDQVLPHLLHLLRSDEDAQNALSALLTLLTEATRSNIILPNLLPTLLTYPMSAFNARALASLADVAGSSMTRKLPNILNVLMDNIVVCKDEVLKAELDTSFDTVLLAVDEFDGLNTMMSVMLSLMKNADHHKRASADMHMTKFFEGSQIDYSRYYPDLIRALLIAFDDGDSEVVKAAWTAMTAMTSRLRKEEMESLVISTRQTLNQVGVAGHNLPGFSLPKGINAILPIFLQGLMNGSAEQRTQAALAISDLVDRTSAEGLRPFVTQITGPLIRVVSERSTDLKSAILLTLNNLLEKIPTFLKPFLPQLQRTFAKSLADPSSEVLRSRAAKALGTLITMTPRIDPLIAELVTGSKTTDAGVQNAMLTALYEVVSKAGANMNDVSKNAILGLIDSHAGETNDVLNITHARLLGALIKILPADSAHSLIKGRVLTTHFTHSSILALNAVLLESPDSLLTIFAEQTQSVLIQGISHPQPFIADNSVLATGKFLLATSHPKTFETTDPIITALAAAISPGNPVDTRRLALVVIRTLSRLHHSELIRPHLAALAPPIFASVRDMVIPVKLAAEAAFLSIFCVVDEEAAIFDKYMAAPQGGAALPPQTKRSMQEYFKRIALRLSNQAKERREAEGGQGGLGLSSDERDDEREVWSVGRVDLGEGVFASDE